VPSEAVSANWKGGLDHFDNIGEAVVTEHWGVGSGVKRHILGFDIFDHQAYYTPMGTATGYDYLHYKFKSSGYFYLNYSIQTSSTLLIQETIGPLAPGDQHIPPFQLADTASDGTYYFSCTAYSPYDVTGNSFYFEDNLLVQRYVDTLEWHPGECRYREDSTFVAPFTNEVGSPCVYPDTSKWYKAYHYVYDYLDGEMLGGDPNISPFFWYKISEDFPIEFYYDTMGTYGPVSEIYTSQNWVWFKMTDFLSYYWCNRCYRELFKVHLPYNDTLGLSGSALQTTESRSELNSIRVDDLGCGDQYVGSYIYWDCQNAVEYGNCDETCDQPDTLGSGCPFLYKWNGFDYQFVDNILPASETELSVNDDVNDNYPIFLINPINTFLYNFKVTEEENEISRLDRFMLHYADLPYSPNELVVNQNNEPMYIINNLELVSAVTDQGIDVLNLLQENDDNKLEIDGPGYVEIEFGQFRSQSNSSLGEPGGPIVVTKPPDKDDDEPPSHPKVAGGTSTRTINYYTISVQDSVDQWRQIARVNPRKLKRLEYVDLANLFNQGVSRIRLGWAKRIRMDNLSFHSVERPAYTPVRAPLVSAVHSVDGQVAPKLRRTDQNYQILRPGEEIELSFRAPDTVNWGDKRVFLFSTRGRYRSLDDPDSSSNAQIPSGFELDQNYPNPFNPVTTFSFSLPQAEHVQLEIYNILGQRVTVLADQEYPAGRHSLEWNSRQADGSEVASGVYFARIKAGEFSATRKMMVVK